MRCTAVRGRGYCRREFHWPCGGYHCPIQRAVQCYVLCTECRTASRISTLQIENADSRLALFKARLLLDAGLVYTPVVGDGSCFFRAVAAQCTGATYHNDWRTLLQHVMKHVVEQWHTTILPSLDPDQLHAEFSVNNEGNRRLCVEQRLDRCYATAANWAHKPPQSMAASWDCFLLEIAVRHTSSAVGRTVVRWSLQHDEHKFLMQLQSSPLLICSPVKAEWPSDRSQIIHVVRVSEDHYEMALPSK